MRNIIRTFKTSHSVFYKIGVLKNFAKIHWRTPGLKSLFNKAASLKVFSFKICILFKSFVLQKTSGGCFWNKMERKRLGGENKIKPQ